MELQSAKEKPGTIVTSSGYCYSDISSSKPNIQTHLANQLQSFESNPEIYSLSSTGMEIIGFPPKNNLQQQQQSHDTNSGLWKGFFTKSGSHHHNHNQQGGPSSSKPTMNESSMIDFHQHDDFTYGGISDHTTSDQNLMVNVAANSTSWHDQNRVLVDDSSLRCVFPCEGNERPSQGLSLSLSASNPSTIGLQSFELRQEGTTEDQLRFVSSSSRSDGFYGNSMNMQDGFLGKAPINLHHHQGQGQGQGHFLIKNSKYLGPTQQLLNEFCNLGTKQQTDQPKIKPHKTTQWQDENAMCSSSKKQSLNTLEILELHKRKTKLLSMLEEVDRRYRGYCDQMKGVVLSFEEAAGNGAAMVYSAMASKAMSRHFRCLRDGIVDQIKATKKTMGEKDTVTPGSTRGETPRLRLLDQTLRQQRAFQQMSMMESHPWRPQRGLPDRSVSVLRAWLFEHFLHPYPSDVDKHILARQTGLSRSQVSNWFINARVRLWKPMVEEMYLEETKEQDKSASSDGISALGDDNGRPSQTSQAHPDDQKPTPTQLIRIDSECFSSIINNPDKNDTPKYNKTPQNHLSHNLHHHHHHHQQQHSFGRVTDTFGAVELDFSSYARQHFGGGGSGSGNGDVSLTLGLQQHGGSGVSLAFSPPSHNSLLYPRDHIEDNQTVHQYSLLDGGGQNLPYRNLMGAQLLHDLAR